MEGCVQNKTPDDQVTIRYLLGDELGQEEQNAIEERLFADDDYLEQVQVLELELMTRYVQNRLTSRERELFENHFLLSRERRDSLKFLTSLFQVRQEAVSSYAAPSAAQRIVEPPLEPQSYERSMQAALRESRLDEDSYASDLIRQALELGPQDERFNVLVRRAERWLKLRRLLKSLKRVLLPPIPKQVYKACGIIALFTVVLVFG